MKLEFEHNLNNIRIDEEKKEYNVKNLKKVDTRHVLDATSTLSGLVK